MRPRLTEIDYAIIAVAPALIMVLVGSLVLFVTELFYEGQHELRLNFILCMFVLGIVSIARISIEQGAVRAVPFGVLLGGLVALAVGRFVPEALVLTCILLAIVWWISTRLVYDCTVVAHSVDGSKKGLMQWIRRGDADESADDPGVEKSATAELDPPQGVTGRDPDDARRGDSGQFTRWFNPTSTQFAPGAWVVYFSLATLPIFGLGQAFAGNRDPASRWYLFTLLVAYVAAALCLLVTTSFLGLRRYLQTRGVRMPLSMTGTWLGVGFGVVALVLITVSILPRPNAEYELAQLPFYEDQQSRQASRFAPGKDGTDDPRANRQRTPSDTEQTDQAATSAESQPDGTQPGNTQSGTAQSNGAEDPNAERSTPGDSSESGRQSSEDSPQESSESQTGQASQDQAGQTSSPQESSASQESSPSDPSSPSQTQPNQAEQPAQGESNESSEGDTQSSSQQSATEQASPEASAAEGDAGASDPPDTAPAESGSASAPTPPSPSINLFSSLGALLKLLFYAILVAAVLFLIWYFREELARSWAEFWASLRGQKRTDSPERPAENVRPVRRRRAFSTFANPFQDPHWKQRPLEEWIRHSFSAVEAWADEQGHGRKEEQTPSEFAAMLEHQFTDLNNAVRRAAELYGQVAYGSGKAPGETTEILRNLWQRLRAAQPTSRSSPESDHASGTHRAKGPS